MPNIEHRTFEAGVVHRLESLLAQGRPEEMLETLFREIVKLSEEEIHTVKSAPTWPARVAAAPTVPREIRAFGEQALDPVQAAQITIPVLLLVGADSPDDVKGDPDKVAQALPDARIRELEGQMHMAHLMAPEAFTNVILGFLRE